MNIRTWMVGSKRALSEVEEELRNRISLVMPKVKGPEEFSDVIEDDGQIYQIDVTVTVTEYEPT